MNLSRTLSAVLRAIIPRLPVFLGNPWLLYLKTSEDVTRGNSMVKSLFVQIGVLYWLSWTTVSAIGERQISGSLTLAMPHGDLFQMHRYRRASSK